MTCGHPHVKIVGVRDDMSAIYQCTDCGDTFRGSELPGSYVPVEP